jgi:flagellar hook assembly protein FlgD
MTLEAVRPASSMELTPVSKGRHETASDVTVFPNPFYHETTIALELPEARRTIIEILNLRGQVIKRLPAQDLPAGHHQFRWDGAGDSGEKAPSGMYFIRIGMGTENLLRKVLLQNF